MTSEHSTARRLLGTAATALATIALAALPLAPSQSWRAELSANPRNGPVIRPDRSTGGEPDRTEAGESGSSGAPIPEETPMVIRPAGKSPPREAATSPAGGKEGERARRAGAGGVPGLAAPKPPLGVEPAKAVVITPLAAIPDSPPAIAATTRKPARPRGGAADKGWNTQIAPAAATAEPVASGAAELDLLPTIDTVNVEEMLATPGMSIDPGHGPGANTAPPADPALATLAAEGKNHTVIEKLPGRPPQASAGGKPSSAEAEPSTEAKNERASPPPASAALGRPADAGKPTSEAPASMEVTAAPPAKTEPAPSASSPVAAEAPADPAKAGLAAASAKSEPVPEASAVAAIDAKPSEPSTSDAPAPDLDDTDAPVMISSDPAMPAAEPAPPVRIVVADTSKARTKGKRDAEKAGTASAKAKPSKAEARQAAMNARVKAKREAGPEDDAPAMITSAPTPRPDKDGKPQDASGLAAKAEPAANAVEPPAAPALSAPILGVAGIVTDAAQPAATPEAVQTTAATAAPASAPPAMAAPHMAAQPRTEPAPAASTATLQADEDEPRDPFVDLHLSELRGKRGEVLTTQVLPSNASPETTGQAAPADRNQAAQYCSNIADAAIDARIAWQRQNLAEAEKQLQARTQELEAKTAEYQRWLARRDEFSEKAKKTVVDIYTKMKPDAAALQLAALEEETAAAVLVKLDARSASAVMNEMEPEKAARLTAIISAAGKGPVPRPRQPAGNRS